MKHFLYALVLFAFAVTAGAQSYAPGLPLPGLPKSLGQKNMANSTSVTMANDQSPITVTGNITTNNSSVGTPGFPMPVSATAIGVKDQSGNLQFIPIGPNGITVSAVASIPAGVGITNTPNVFIPNGVGITNTPNVMIPNGVGITNTPNVLIPNGVGITNTPTVLQGNSPWSVSIPAGVGITNTVTATTTPSTVSTSTITRVGNTLANQTLLASNANRKQLFLYLDDPTANCYIKFGVTASLTSYTFKMFATDTYIMDPPPYTGQIDYICDLASGNMEVNEQ